MIYLASPYSHEDPKIMDERFEAVCKCTAYLSKMGLVVFSPIAHSHNLVKYDLPTSWEFWSRIDMAFISRCDELWALTLDGYRESKGVTAEIQIAREIGMKVVFISPLEVEQLKGE